MMEASKLARLKQERLREAEAYLALSNDEGRGLSAEKLSALRAASRFRVRRHTCDPSQGDEDVWMHDKIMAACTAKGAEPENRGGMEQGPASREDLDQEAGSTSTHLTQASRNEGHVGSVRTAHPSQPTKPDTRRGPDTKNSSRQPAQHPDHDAAAQLPPPLDHAAAQPPPLDRLEAGLGQPITNCIDTAADGAGMAGAEEEQRQQELSRGEEVLQDFKSMQSATAAEVEARRKAIPKQNMAYTLDTQLLQAEFMVANGMHLTSGQRAKILYRPLSYAGDEAGASGVQGDFDERPSDPGPTNIPSLDSPPLYPIPPQPLLQVRNSAPSLFPERFEPSSTFPKRRPPKEPGLPPKPLHFNSVGQALLGAPPGMAAVQAGVTASFIAKVPPLIPRGSVSDSGFPQAQDEQQLQEAGDATARLSPRKQRGLPVPADALQPLLHLSSPSHTLQRHSSQPQAPPPGPAPSAFGRSSVDSCFAAKDAQPQLPQLPLEPQAAAELQQRQQKQVKLPPLLQKGEPVHKHKANNGWGAQTKKPLPITGWVQTGGGMNHRLLSGRKPDKAS